MKTSGVEHKCPKSVTFREFVEFTLPVFDENWAPVVELCNPCRYKPHVVGKVGTMRDDTFYTLTQVSADQRIYSYRETRGYNFMAFI